MELHEHVGPVGWPAFIRHPATLLWSISLIAIVFGLVGTGVLVDGVLEHGDLSGWDPGIATAVVAERGPSLTVLAQLLTFLGSATALAPLTIITVGVLVVFRRWLAAAAVAGAMAVSLLLTVVLKDVIGRVRPAAVDVLGPVNTGFAFPSGHTLNSTVFYGLAAGLLMLSIRRTWIRVLIGVSWLALALGVGISRIYLGYHWMTDVAAGWALGIAVLGAVLLATNWVWRRRRPHPTKDAVHWQGVRGQ